MALELENFIGDWRDSMGNDVLVQWAKPGSRGGQLDVQLSKARGGGNVIKLNVKQLGDGRFTCGHYDCDASQTDVRRVTWVDHRNTQKRSIWDRAGEAPAAAAATRVSPYDSHSSSMGRAATPGAWTPPSQAAVPSSIGDDAGLPPPVNGHGPPGQQPHYPPQPDWLRGGWLPPPGQPPLYAGYGMPPPGDEYSYTDESSEEPEEAKAKKAKTA